MKNIAPDVSGSSSFPRHLTDVDGTLFFTARQHLGRALWKSDGTESGTVMVKDLHPSTGQEADPTDLVNANGTLFFRADDGTHGVRLWMSDGTEAGTVRTPGGYGAVGPPIAVGPVVVFSAADEAGMELWKSDGTPAGTRRIGDIAPLGSSNPRNLTRAGDLLFFKATTNETGDQLYAFPVAALTDAELDGLLDADERALGTDEFDADSDDDGLLDGAEVHVHGTDPLDADTDGDGYDDGVEVPAGSDPLDPQSVPTAVPLTGAWGYAALAALLLAAARARRRAT